MGAQRIELVGFTLEELRAAFERYLDRLEVNMARESTELIAWSLSIDTSTQATRP